jgi:hypothetical protein
MQMLAARSNNAARCDKIAVQIKRPANAQRQDRRPVIYGRRLCCVGQLVEIYRGLGGGNANDLALMTLPLLVIARSSFSAKVFPSR